MVKPHSPIAECRKRSPSPKGQKTLRSICKVVGLPEDSGSVSPRKVNSAAQFKTRVSFSRKVTVKQTLHMNDMSEKVRNRYWLTADEHSKIKENCRSTVLMMMGRIDADSDFCPRGLESRTKDGQKTKNERKDAARRAVLLQQKLQQEEGMVDPEFIAAISSTKTKVSAEEAREAALKDAEEAWLYHHEDL